MQLNRRQIHLQQTHILHDQRIRACLVKLPREIARRFQFVIVKNGVESDKHTRMVAMRMRCQPCDVGHGIFRLGSRAECRTADIYRIRAMIYGLDTDIGIAGGSKQFEMAWVCLHKSC